MMSDINVLIYSYKGKNTKSVIENLIKNKSQNTKLSIRLIDQHPLDRKDLFSSIDNLQYHHLFWDWPINPCEYKHNFIKKSKSEYTMMLGDNIMLKENWDLDLINYLKDKNVVISGAGKTVIEQKNIFYIKKNKMVTTDFTLDNFVDRSFIFSKTEILSNLFYPTYMKYNGEEEHISLSLFCSGVDIYSAPSNMYLDVMENTLETLYVPFSLDHNYNEVIDILSKGYNSYHSTLFQNRSLNDFIQFHNFDFKKIKKLPFLRNDVLYDPQNLNINKIDARRFIDRTKEIS